MRIKNLFTTLVMFITIQLVAQSPVTPDYAKAIGNFTFGIKSGVNISNQNASLDMTNIPMALTTINTSSYHFGVYGNFKLSEKIGILTELLYSEEGSMVNLQAIAFKQQVNYIKFPLMFNYKPFFNGLSFQFGPQFGYMVSDKIDIDNNQGGQFISADFKSFETSIVIGAEYYLTQKLKVGGRYNLGLSDISKTDVASFKNTNIQFYLGFDLF